MGSEANSRRGLLGYYKLPEAGKVLKTALQFCFCQTAFSFWDQGMASALTMVMVLILLVIAAFQLLFLDHCKHNERYDHHQKVQRARFGTRFFYLLTLTIILHIYNQGFTLLCYHYISIHAIIS